MRRPIKLCAVGAAFFAAGLGCSGTSVIEVFPDSGAPPRDGGRDGADARGATDARDASRKDVSREDAFDSAGDTGTHPNCADSGDSFCSSGCTNLQTDPANCGDCAHSCLPGGCSKGKRPA
jgi:hypothetical protein